MRSVTIIGLLLSTGYSKVCCADYQDDRWFHDCQRWDTPPGNNNRVLPDRKKDLYHMDMESNVLAHVKAKYPDFPADYKTCCVLACCHRTSWGEPGTTEWRSGGKPHFTIRCNPTHPDGTPVPPKFHGPPHYSKITGDFVNYSPVHYNCNDGTIQSRRRMERFLNDPVDEVTLTSDAPEWVDLAIPDHIRRLQEAEDEGSYVSQHSNSPAVFDEDQPERTEDEEDDEDRRRIPGAGYTKTMHYVGCFRDDANRDLDQYMGNGKDIESCSDHCAQYQYFALQYHGECRCGNQYNTASNYHLLADSACGQDLKGGAWSNAVFMHDNYNIGLTVFDHSFFLDPQMSSTWSSGYAAQNCLNGNKDNFCHSRTNSNEWLRFSLMSPITVNKVLLANVPNFWGAIGRVDIRLYNDAAQRWEVCNTGVPMPRNKQWKDVFCHRPTRASKIQIQTADGYWFYIADVKVVGMVPRPQFIGCFRDDASRDLDVSAGQSTGPADCAHKCRHHYYFGLQNYNECFCGYEYATAPQYEKTHPNNCGSDLSGRQWTNAIFATHGGIPVHGVKMWRRRATWEIPVPHEIELLHNTTGIPLNTFMKGWINGLEMLDTVVTEGMCLASNIEDWVQHYPWTSVAIAGGIVLITAAAFFFGPEIMAGVGAYAGFQAGETAFIDMIGFAISGAGKVPLAVSGGSMIPVLGVTELVDLGGAAYASASIMMGSADPNGDLVRSVLGLPAAVSGVGNAVNSANNAVNAATNAVNGVIESVGRWFGLGRRRLEEIQMQLATGEPHEISVEEMLAIDYIALLKQLETDNMHDALAKSFQKMHEEYGTKEELMQFEMEMFENVSRKLNIEFDDTVKKDLEEYFDSFDDLLEKDIDLAAECLEKGCSIGRLTEMLSEDDVPSGEGEPVGSAGPVEGSTHDEPANSQHDEPVEVLGDVLGKPTLVELPEETPEDFPEPNVDESVPEPQYVMNEDGVIVHV